MRICLATAHCKPAFIPLALLYLKACLVDQKGLPDEDVTILEFGPDASVEEIARRVIAAHADVVAFSCYVFDDDGLCLVTQRAWSKKVWPGVWTNSVKRPASS